MPGREAYIARLRARPRWSIPPYPGGCASTIFIFSQQNGRKRSKKKRRWVCNPPPNQAISSFSALRVNFRGNSCALSPAPVLRSFSSPQAGQHTRCPCTKNRALKLPRPNSRKQKPSASRGCDLFIASCRGGVLLAFVRVVSCASRSGPYRHHPHASTCAARRDPGRFWAALRASGRCAALGAFGRSVSRDGVSRVHALRLRDQIPRDAAA